MMCVGLAFYVCFICTRWASDGTWLTCGHDDHTTRGHVASIHYGSLCHGGHGALHEDDGGSGHHAPGNKVGVDAKFLISPVEYRCAVEQAAIEFAYNAVNKQELQVVLVNK